MQNSSNEIVVFSLIDMVFSYEKCNSVASAAVLLRHFLDFVRIQFSSHFSNPFKVLIVGKYASLSEEEMGKKTCTKKKRMKFL